MNKPNTVPSLMDTVDRYLYLSLKMSYMYTSRPATFLTCSTADMVCTVLVSTVSCTYASGTSDVWDFTGGK